MRRNCRNALLSLHIAIGDSEDDSVIRNAIRRRIVVHVVHLARCWVHVLFKRDKWSIADCDDLRQGTHALQCALHLAFKGVPFREKKSTTGEDPADRFCTLKFHLINHMATCIFEFGPPLGWAGLVEEGMHKVVKKLAHRAGEGDARRKLAILVKIADRDAVLRHSTRCAAETETAGETEVFTCAGEAATRAAAAAEQREARLQAARADAAAGCDDGTDSYSESDDGAIGHAAQRVSALSALCGGRANSCREAVPGTVGISSYSLPPCCSPCCGGERFGAAVPSPSDEAGAANRSWRRRLTSTTAPPRRA